MQNSMTGQRGMTLIELMLGLMLTVVLLSGIFGLLSTSLVSWKSGISRSEVQQTARFAVDSMVRDLRYGDNYELGNDGRSITYRNIKSGQYGNTYRYHVSTADHKLYKTGIIPQVVSQPVTGENVKGANYIILNPDNQALFRQPDPSKPDTITITVEAKDTVTGHSFVLYSAVTSLTQTFK